VVSSGPATPPTWREWKARNRSKRWYWRYPLAIEWAFEQVNHGLHQWAFVEFLEYAGRFTILVVAIFWVVEADSRAKERHYRAWELINAARGSTGDGGRKDALQDLNKDHVMLAGAPLEQAYLAGVDLQGANLSFAKLQGADLRWANLQGAYLSTANLGLADLWDANLQGADLRWANLQATRHLTQEQLNTANGDDRTQLPADLIRPAHWLKTEGPEDRPAPQPDGAGRAPAADGAPGSDK
jgi:hypothetical protein